MLYEVITTKPDTQPTYTTNWYFISNSLIHFKADSKPKLNVGINTKVSKVLTSKPPTTVIANGRITSYNVCYTKLLRNLKESGNVLQSENCSPRSLQLTNLTS